MIPCTEAITLAWTSATKHHRRRLHIRHQNVATQVVTRTLAPAQGYSWQAKGGPSLRSLYIQRLLPRISECDTPPLASATVVSIPEPTGATCSEHTDQYLVISYAETATTACKRKGGNTQSSGNTKLAAPVC